MEMVNHVLTTRNPIENISGAARKNEDPDRKEDGHYCPEKRHEDDATSIFEDSRQDKIAVEGEPSFLNLRRTDKQLISRQGVPHTSQLTSAIAAATTVPVLG
jgi:hypothetical protein